MDALQAIEKRRSTRNYLSRPISRDKLDILLKAGASAPKAGDFHICMVLNAQVLRQINDQALSAMKNSANDFLMSRANLPGYQPLYGAPALMVISAAADNPYGMANASNAATTACIAATALNLGSCYLLTPTLALNNDQDLCKRIGMPDGYKPMCAVALGFRGDVDRFSASRAPGFENYNYCE